MLKTSNKNLTREILFKIMSMLPGHIYCKDKKGIYLWSNDEQAKFLGYKCGDDLIGKTDFDLPWKSKAKQLKAIDMQVMNTKETYSIEEIVITLEGKKEIFLSRKYPLYDDDGNNVLGIIGLSMNITESKQAEIAKQEFLINMSHDIRTPLTAIIGLANCLVTSGIQNNLIEYCNMIIDSIEKFLVLCNSILEVKTTEYCVEDIAKNVVCCKELATKIKTLMQVAFFNKKLDFKVNVDKNMPLICTDQTKLELMIIHLLSNALKFTKKGKISLDINLLSKEDDKAKIEILVSDTGIGISEDKLDKIFDIFYRIHPSYEGQYDGYGMGLSLVKNTVKRLDGEIKVQSEVGKGSCFKVTLNVPIVLDSIEDGSIKHQNVLIVDDDELNSYSTKKLLLSLGYSVLTKSTGEAALEILKKTQAFDWVLMDITLPDIKGTEVIKRYRQWEREHNKPKLPIFAFEKDLSKETIREYIKIGFNNVLTKPFTKNSINTIALFK